MVKMDHPVAIACQDFQEESIFRVDHEKRDVLQYFNIFAVKRLAIITLGALLSSASLTWSIWFVSFAATS